MIVLALSPEADPHAVGGQAEALGLEVVRLVVEDEDSPQRDVLLADEARATTVRYVQDFYLDLAYLAVVGPREADLAEGFAALAFDPDVLLDVARAGLDPTDREAMKTYVRLALTADEARRPAVLDLFARVAEAGHEAEAFTLIAALGALGIWPGALAEAAPLVQRLAAHPSEMVRDEAAHLAAALAAHLRRN